MFISYPITRILLLLAASIMLNACSVTNWEDKPTEEQRYACGRLCLKNGESCSRFFAQKNQEKRLAYEQSKQNFWICLRKYPGALSQTETPCIAPPPVTEEFDNCGAQLDECLTTCGTTLEEIGTRQQQEQSRAANPEPETTVAE